MSPDSSARPAADPTSLQRDRWRPHPEVVAQRLGTGGVLVDLRSGAIFELNATGIRIWDLLAEGKSRGEIVAMCQSESNGPVAVIERDVEELIARLAESHLIEE